MNANRDVLDEGRLKKSKNGKNNLARSLSEGKVWKKSIEATHPVGGSGTDRVARRPS